MKLESDWLFSQSLFLFKVNRKIGYSDVGDIKFEGHPKSISYK